MSTAHVCSLPQRDTSGLPKLPPNASCCRRLFRKFRKLIIVNPNHSRCKYFSYNKSVIMSEQRRHIKSRYSYIIHPLSTLSTMLEITFVVLWMGRMLSEPIIDNMIEVDNFASWVFDHIIFFTQLALIASFFFVGYIDMTTKEVVIEHKRIILRYLTSYFVFDFMSTDILTASYFSTITDSIHDENLVWYIYYTIRYVHLPCLFVRLNTILNYLDHIGRLMKLKNRIRKGIIYFVRTYMHLHFFGCMLYLIAKVMYESSVWPEDSWLVDAKIDPSAEASLIKIYGECMLMTICFFFGATAKYTVYQTSEQVGLAFVAFFGRLYTLFLIADALRIFGIAGISESNYERELSQLNEYMRTNDFSIALRSKTIKYFEYKFQKRYFDELDILNNLSEHLRTQICLFFASTIMQKCTVFKHVPQTELVALFSTMKLVTFTPGDFIYKPGQHIEDIYFISSGSVAILNKEGVELCHLEDGEVLGLCIVLIGKEIHSALVLESTDLLVIEKDRFYQFLEDYPEAAEYMHRMGRERLNSFKQIELIIKMEKGGCLDDVRNGMLLEKRRERTTQ